MRNAVVVILAATLAACGGGGESAGGSPGDLAAQACKVALESRLDGKIYTLDLVALAASMKDAPNGEKFLTSPVVIEPGLTSEVKQIIECNVRFNEGKPTPDVVGFGFNW